MKTLAKIWKLINIPSSFEDSPYVEMVNQFSHIALGAMVSAMIYVSWFFLTGDLPSRYIVLLSVCLGYTLIVETLIQGWRGIDSAMDALFVSWGAVLIFVSIGGNTMFIYDLILIDFRPKMFVFGLSGALLSLVIHIQPRLRKHGKRN